MKWRMAPTGGSRSPLVHPLLTLAVLTAAAGPAGAQGAPARSLSVSTALDTQLSYTVNSARGGREAGDFVTSIRPSVLVNSRSGRVIGRVSYAADWSEHSQPYDGPRLQNQLAASLSAEAVPRFAYLDVNANIAQQQASAYGTISAPGSTTRNDNLIEVGTLSIAPYVRGVFGSAVNYELRYTGTFVNGRRSIEADSSTRTAQAALSSVTAGSLLGWGLNASSSIIDFRAGRETQSDRWLASVSWLPDPDWTGVLRGGQERTNVADTVQTTYSNWGAGLTWRPSPRTRLQADYDDRFFGDGYRVLLEYRLPQSSVRLSSSRDTSTGGGASTGTATLSQLLNAQLANVEPDPVAREQLVLALLRANNQDPNTRVSSGFISSAVTLQQSHQLALAYAGRRLSLGAQLAATRSEVIDALAAAQAREPVRQQSIDVTLGYRLTPRTSVSMGLTQQRTRATLTRGANQMDSVFGTISSQLGRRVTGSLAGRYAEYDGSTDSYREASLAATLSLRF